jgi:4-carboxymuconolactone decarboxylase
MDAEVAAVYQFCTELHEAKGVSDAAFKAVADRFGEQGVIDLIGVTGYYTMMAMVINVAREPLPDGIAPPLAPIGRD